MRNYARTVLRPEQATEASLCFFMWVSRSTLNCQAATWLGWVHFISSVSKSQAPCLASIERDRHSLTPEVWPQAYFREEK